MKRRQFIKKFSYLTGAGSIALSIGKIPIRAYSSPFLNIPTVNGKVLVIVQLKGGNDGLNSVIPIEDSIYYTKRPDLAISKDEAIKLNHLIGLHPSLSPFKNLYDEGLLNIVQNVGYKNPNRSHFRSTDIWLSGSDSDVLLFDGWAGRFLTKVYPDYPGIHPAHPMAIQIGSTQSLLLESQYGGMGVSIEDPNQFYQLVLGSEVDEDPPPETIAGNELKYLKQVSAQSIQYAEIIKSKADASSNMVSYPNTKLAAQLAIIAELIAGGLETPIYLTTIKGFDTHSNQLNRHKSLLKEVSEAIESFQKDLKLLSIDGKVLTMTISEFGRRVQQNGSAGTDHGTAAPMFIFGKEVSGGITGENPNLSSLDNRGDIKYVYDYRQVYATVLKDHFQMIDHTIEDIFLGKFETLSFLSDINNTEPIPNEFILEQNYPNPFNNSTTIKYSVPQLSNVKITVYDTQGKNVATLVEGDKPDGNYTIQFNAKDLSSGTYFYQMQAGDFQTVKKMILLR